MFLNYPFVDHLPFAGLQVTQWDVANLDADEPQGRKSYSGGHVAHLSVLAFDESETYPAGWDVGTVADGRHPFPKVFGCIDDFRLARFGAVAFDGHTSFQLVDSLLCDLPVYLREIGARMLKFWVQ